MPAINKAALSALVGPLQTSCRLDTSSTSLLQHVVRLRFPLNCKLLLQQAGQSHHTARANTYFLGGDLKSTSASRCSRHDCRSSFLAHRSLVASQDLFRGHLLSFLAADSSRDSRFPRGCGRCGIGSHSALGHQSSMHRFGGPGPDALEGQNPGKSLNPSGLVNVEGLEAWLEERLPDGRQQLQAWGQEPGTKRLANLWKELTEGEICLEDGRPPKRTVHVASVKISDPRGMYLVESHQEMGDGRVRERNRPLSEKMRPGEDVSDACLRGIFEELGAVLGAREGVTLLPDSYLREEEERESFSYPGLLTRYVVHTMEARIAVLPQTDFFTVENEHCDESGTNGAADSGGNGAAKSGGGGSGAAAPPGPVGSAVAAGSSQWREPEEALGVKRHFWTWSSDSSAAGVGGLIC